MSDPALPLALDIIQRFEGCRLQPYTDVGGVWTVGWGSTVMPDGTRVTVTSRAITQVEANAMLQKTVADTLSRVRAMVYTNITDAQAAALCSFAYNLGTRALRDSTLLRDVNLGDMQAAAAQFGAWVYAGRPSRLVQGLVNRRSAERALFLSMEQPTQHTADTDDLNARELARIQGA